MVGIRKFVNEFLQEWPILFMDVEQANEWLSEKRRMENSSRNATSVHYDIKNGNSLRESLILEPVLSQKRLYIQKPFSTTSGDLKI